jgi:uncharacterized protein YjbJ (UPF0337 family)
MKPSTKQELAGTLNQLKGAAKEKAGQVTNNPTLTADGQNQKLAGTVQRKIGQIKKVFEK